LSSTQSMKLGMLTRSLLILLALGVCCAWSRAVVPPLLLLRQAERVQETKEYTRALDLYGELAALRPFSATPHARMGQIYVAQGRWLEAQTSFALAGQLDADDTEALRGLAEVAYHYDDPIVAIQLWTDALAEDPCDAQTRSRLGRTYIDLARFDLAEQQLQRAILCDSHHQRSHYLLGLIAAGDGDPRALEWLRIAADGEDPTLATSAQEVLELLAEPTEIGDGASPDGSLAAAYLKYDLPGLAIRELQRILGVYPSNQTARAYLGYALLSSGQPAQAQRELRQASHSDPKNPVVLYFLGLVHRSQGYLRAAIWDFKRSLQLDPSNAAAYAQIADASTQIGQYGVAEEWYRAAVAVAPGEPGFQLLLAQFQVDVVPKADAGLEAAQEAAALNPKDPLAQDLLGWAYYLAGDPDKARDTLESSLQLDSDFARAYYHLGVVCSELGDVKTGQWAYQRAIDLDSEGEYRRKASRELLPAR
jgi:tetratricopeptide (TPR) repeat protein